MKVSLITGTYNSGKTLQDTIHSVALQDYHDIEYIIVDGGSTDNTLQIIKENSHVVTNWVSEPDKGIYDAMNKGIMMSTGDIVGIINSDDFYHRNDSISVVVENFKNHRPQCVFADIVFVDPDNTKNITRYFSSKRFHPSKFKYGFIPAHPTFFTYRENFIKYGYYKTNYKIAADFELLLRFLHIHQLSYRYIPTYLLTMRTGGVSTSSIRSTVTIVKENFRAFKENGEHTNYFYLLLRYVFKIFQFFPKINPNLNLYFREKSHDNGQ